MLSVAREATMIDTETYRRACCRILAGHGTRTDYAIADRYHAQEAAR